MIKIFPYNPGSRSALDLRSALRSTVLLRQGSRYVPRETHTVVNWGSSSLPLWDLCRVGKILNHPLIVAIHSNKLNFFRSYSGTSMTVPWTTAIGTALEWQAEGDDVMARHILNGHSGAGLELVRPSEPMPSVPLYTKRIRGVREYRVHTAMINDEAVIVSTQAKALREGRGIPNGYHCNRIRTHGNGFVFTRHLSEDIPGMVHATARFITKISGLDFMAVDIIYNEARDRAYAIEVNTAPALAGETLNDYKSTIKLLDTHPGSSRRAQRVASIVSSLWGELDPTPLRVPTGLAPVGLLSDIDSTLSLQGAGL